MHLSVFIKTCELISWSFDLWYSTDIAVTDSFGYHAADMVLV